jgi:hypothetical protein
MLCFTPLVLSVFDTYIYFLILTPKALGKSEAITVLPVPPLAATAMVVPRFVIISVSKDYYLLMCLTHIPHFKFIKMSVSEFHPATNPLNEVRYADLVSYAQVTSDPLRFIPPFVLSRFSTKKKMRWTNLTFLLPLCIAFLLPANVPQ